MLTSDSLYTEMKNMIYSTWLKNRQNTEYSVQDAESITVVVYFIPNIAFLSVFFCMFLFGVCFYRSVFVVVYPNALLLSEMNSPPPSQRPTDR